MPLQTKNLVVPGWAKNANPQPFTYADAPRQYRFDGEQGQFYLGERGQGNGISAHIFAHRWFNGPRWGRPSQSWLDIGFIDEDNVVAVMALKKESAINLHEFFVTLEQMNVFSPMACKVMLTAEERNGEDGDYYVVTAGSFDFVTQPLCDSLAQFISDIRFDWIFTGESGDG